MTQNMTDITTCPRIIKPKWCPISASLRQSRAVSLYAFLSRYPCNPQSHKKMKTKTATHARIKRFIFITISSALVDCLNLDTSGLLTQNVAHKRDRSRTRGRWEEQ